MERSYAVVLRMHNDVEPNPASEFKLRLSLGSRASLDYYDNVWKLSMYEVHQPKATPSALIRFEKELKKLRRVAMSQCVNQRVLLRGNFRKRRVASHID